jgi:hypothetical protein
MKFFCISSGSTAAFKAYCAFYMKLTSVLDGVGGQGHAPAALPPGKNLYPLYTGGWVGPRAGLDRCGKSCPHRDSIPGPSSP